MKKGIEIKIIGLGGIGSWLLDFIARYARFTMLQNKKITITLVDGDSYDSLNRPRQNFQNLGNKARIKKLEMDDEYSKYVPPGFTLENFEFAYVDDYVNPDNIEEIIVDGDVVFLCVDNHKTRCLVSEHCRTLENVTLISGGNDITVGNVQIYLKKEGEETTADMCAYHPEIKNPRDKAPYEKSCEELQVSEPQLIFTNGLAAILMCCAYYNVVTGTINKDNRIGETYFDIQTMKCVSHIRIPKN